MHRQRTTPALSLAAALALTLLLPPLATAQQRDRNGDGDRDRDTQRNRRDDRSGIPRALEDRIRQRYADARLELVREGPINNVETYLVRIQTNRGETTARGTADGDLLYLGHPGDNQRLPRDVARIVEDMFASRPLSVQKFERTLYLVSTDFGAGGGAYHVVLDAVGRVYDIRTPTETRGEKFEEGQRASRDVEKRLLSNLDKYFKRPEIKRAWRQDESSDFYWAETSNADERQVFVLMNPDGELDQWRVKMEERDIPENVLRAFREVFKKAPVNAVYRNPTILHQLVYSTGREEGVLLTVHPTGDVQRITDASEEDLRTDTPPAERLDRQARSRRDRDREREQDRTRR